MTESKTYRTLTEVLNMPAGESEPIIMRAAPAIASVADGVGLFDAFFDEDFLKLQDSKAFAKLPKKEQQRIESKVSEMGKTLSKNLLAKGLGECLPDVKDILAAINGVTLAELNERYSTLEVIAMARALLSDKGFLSLVRTFGSGEQQASA